MKGKSLFLTALATGVAGIILLLTFESIKSTGVVICGGALFILAGLINMILYTSNNQKAVTEEGEVETRRSAVATTFSWITSAAAVVLGLSMLIFQETFITLVPFIFGILIAIGALHQVFVLAYGCRPAKLSPWFYLMAAALVAVAVYVFNLQPEENDREIMLSGGIALVAFALVTLVESIIISRQLRKLRKAEETSASEETQQPLPTQVN
jgi:hypothetical protein